MMVRWSGPWLFSVVSLYGTKQEGGAHIEKVEVHYVSHQSISGETTRGCGLQCGFGVGSWHGGRGRPSPA